jgi:glucose-1-phosphate thymidylyltransferase
LYAIILAGGYATRLWPLTKGTPKALLPIAGKPILNYILEKLQAIQPPLSSVIISTNLLFQQQFESWLSLSGYRDVTLIPDDASNEVEKPGAIKALANIIAFAHEDDVMVLAGDGIFNDDLSDMVKVFCKTKRAVVAVYSVDTCEEAKRCAVITLDKKAKITSFAEKPVDPKTTTVCGAVYIFRKTIGKRLVEYIEQRLPADQPGRFIEWLHKQEPVYGYTLKDPLRDIGTPEAYKACDEDFGRYVQVEKANNREVN